MARVWKLKEAQPAPEQLAELSHVHPFVVRLLRQRGIPFEHIEAFLHPAYKEQYDPFLFRDMQKATDRIWQAIDEGQQIVIYSDYDADAITANAVLQQTFRYLGVPVESYVPDRFTEGYGLNIDAFEKIKAAGADLVITVDCGTNSVEVADWCATHDLDLIITDHHEITGLVPKSFALVNPKNPADAYPDSQITGVGVAYKLAKALLDNKSKVEECRAVIGESYIEHWDKWLLDLVAIGTVADCHSLLGENRIFVKYGLLVLAKTKWPGLRALLGQLSTTGALAFDTYTLGFGLAPRINAAGRLEHANIALDALLAEDVVTATETAVALEKINLRRQDVTARLISEAREQALLQKEYAILVLAGADWPKGVVGIAAGRLAGEFGKPTIVLELGEEYATGSARTYGAFDLVEALKATSSHLTKFGGHKEAAGLTLKSADLEAFKSAIIKYADEVRRASSDSDELILELDAELSANELSLDFFDILEQMAPFGAGNPKPQFWLKNASMLSCKAVGVEGRHVQIVFGVGGVEVQGIAFNQGHIPSAFPVGSSVELAVELLADSWKGLRRFKVRVIDIRALQI